MNFSSGEKDNKYVVKVIYSNIIDRNVDNFIKYKIIYKKSNIIDSDEIIVPANPIYM